jgi:hypothetical protein
LKFLSVVILQNSIAVETEEFLARTEILVRQREDHLEAVDATRRDNLGQG